MWLCIYAFCHLFSLCLSHSSFHKVIVPSVYNEYSDGNLPTWLNSTEFMTKYHYSVTLYQKRDPKSPHYIAYNRGTEAGVYLRYIVDHYHHFPEIAVFVHAAPEDHNPRWMDVVRCIRRNATYFNINFEYLSRDTDYWEYMGASELYVEQCWREILKISWGLEDNLGEFNKRVPFNAPISVNFSCCQQFFLSRQWVHRRPLHVWKRLLQVVGEQASCKLETPDFPHLYTTQKYKRTNNSALLLELGPEPSLIRTGPPEDPNNFVGHGIATQGGAMEHLSHVVYGLQPLHVPLKPTMRELCDQFHIASECDGGVWATVMHVPDSDGKDTSTSSSPVRLISPCDPSQL